MTSLSFIVKCEYASKVKSILGMQPSDWLEHVIPNENMTKISALQTLKSISIRSDVKGAKSDSLQLFKVTASEFFSFIAISI